MPWYSAGTVTVTNGSITVTGSGTQFSANVRVGDAFRGPDGGWYEVTNVASATVLSINPAYEGANAAGAVYRIAPIQGYVKESADRLRMIVEQWGNELSSLAPWSTSPDADTALDELGASEVGKALIMAIDAAAGRLALELGAAAQTDYATQRIELIDVPAGQYINCTRIGNLVVVSSEKIITHLSLPALIFPGIIPTDFRPTGGASNTYYFAGSGVGLVLIRPNGDMEVIYQSVSTAAPAPRVNSAAAVSIAYVLAS